ncbi:unnamed protein product [Paramecium sonneborni]|uniref:Uncharacterized protein n=1 Tax=Paramecium sonneborni TaxID=65129 RepID=A0A8S1NDF4_9CILI|nr:unnamed protein product [Paramecium sonneborni]
MLKSLLNGFLSLHHQNHQLLYQDLYKYAEETHTFSNNMYVLSNTKNKLKFSLVLLSRIKSTHFYWLMSFTTISYLTYYQNEIQQKHKNYLERKELEKKKKLEPKIPITGCSIVINEVLRKESINKMLGELIVRIDNKESTQHNIAKQLCKLGNLSFLYDKTFNLTKDLLIQQVFMNDDIQLKLRDLLIKVLNNQRAQVVALANDQLRTNAMDLAIKNLANLYNQEGFQQGLSNALIGAMYSYLDDKNTITELLKLLQKME